MNKFFIVAMTKVTATLEVSDRAVCRYAMSRSLRIVNSLKIVYKQAIV